MKNDEFLYEQNSLVARLNGAVKRYNNTLVATDIGFIDELLQECANNYFREICFADYMFFSPRPDLKRRFLKVGNSDFFENDEIIYIRATPDKFHTPSHRDYMGALMSLGIDRKYFGDLLVTDSSTAYFPLWNRADMCRHLFDNFLSCGKAKITLDVVDRENFLNLELAYEEIEIIVTSLRADCFVSSITGLSRTQAKKIIEAGDFKISSHAVFDPDTLLKTGADFSVRGYGKYKFYDITGATRKERTRLKLLKYGNYIERIL